MGEEDNVVKKLKSKALTGEGGGGSLRNSRLENKQFRFLGEEAAPAAVAQ